MTAWKEVSEHIQDTTAYFQRKVSFRSRTRRGSGCPHLTQPQGPCSEHWNKVLVGIRKAKVMVEGTTHYYAWQHRLRKKEHRDVCKPVVVLGQSLALTSWTEMVTINDTIIYVSTSHAKWNKESAERWLVILTSQARGWGHGGGRSPTVGEHRVI